MVEQKREEKENSNLTLDGNIGSYASGSQMGEILPLRGDIWQSLETVLVVITDI